MGTHIQLCNLLMMLVIRMNINGHHVYQRKTKWIQLGPFSHPKNGKMVEYRTGIMFDTKNVYTYYIVLYLYIICLDHLYKYIYIYYYYCYYYCYILLYITVFSTNGKNQLRRLKIDAYPESVKNIADAGALHRLWFLSIGQSFFHWINGNFKILKWRYCTIFLAIFSGDIPWNLGLINRPCIWDWYLQSRILKWPFIEVRPTKVPSAAHNGNDPSCSPLL